MVRQEITSRGNRHGDQRPQLGRRQRPSEESSEGETSVSLVPTRMFIMVLGLSALLVGVYIQAAKNISESLSQPAQEQSDGRLDGRLDDTLIVADNMDNGYLDHVVGSLLKFGHGLSFRGSMTPMRASDLQQFKLIWTHDYPFRTIKRLEPHQRINHFPGASFITNKHSLLTTPNLLVEANLLKAFRIPAEKDKFLAYAKENPSKLWVQKGSNHRAIRLTTADDVQFDSTDGIGLVQEYMANPMLIDGRKFDIGIYAVLTSVRPLRVYIYEAESLLRFCTQPYLNKQSGTFNHSNANSFIVGDKYTPIWSMPSLIRYFVDTNLSMKQTLNSYLRRLNKDSSKMWRQIESTIQRVYQSKEPYLARLSRLYQEGNNYNSTSVEGSLNQFFEMVRFDFIVDEELNVFLMEANLSPSLSSRHFPPNRIIFEQVLNSFFSLVGLTPDARQLLSDLPVHHLDGRMSLPIGNIKSNGGGRLYGLDGLISDKDLSVSEDLCVSDECHMNCQITKCRICYFCLDNPTKLHLRRAIYEQTFKWNFKRILPSTRDEDYQMQLVHPGGRKTPLQSNDPNYIHVQWFRGKCSSDQRFCST